MGGRLRCVVRTRSLVQGRKTRHRLRWMVEFCSCCRLALPIERGRLAGLFLKCVGDRAPVDGDQPSCLERAESLANQPRNARKAARLPCRAAAPSWRHPRRLAGCRCCGLPDWRAACVSGGFREDRPMVNCPAPASRFVGRSLRLVRFHNLICRQTFHSLRERVS